VPQGTAVEQVSNASNQCGDQVMYTSSVNIHYHGTTSSPTCHQDEVIRTVINSGETFQYNVNFPNYQPTGLYWYHPHIHGIAEAAVLGGASAALIMSGLQNYVPQIVGLPERVLLVRDQPVAGSSNPGDTCAGNSNVTPSWDLIVNYVPLQFLAATCTYTPAVIEMHAGQQELWRVCNCGADTILDIQIQFDGQAQQLQLVALDGVAINSQNRRQQGSPETVTDILLAPAARAEFIVTGPQSGQKASFATLNIDTGPDGDVDPTRTIATIKTDAPTTPPVIPPVTQSIPTSIPAAQRLANLTPTVHRTLYFSEVLSDPTNPDSPTNFFITVDGATPVLFDPNNPPAMLPIRERSKTGRLRTGRWKITNSTCTRSTSWWSRKADTRCLRKSASSLTWCRFPTGAGADLIRASRCAWTFGARTSAISSITVTSSAMRTRA
jgi:FtsP/CotA-like multicopper oxidase with cupredoxin domain